ncbi:protein-L-isoaspartate(D-aspartate) O-methyltransferase [Halorubrum sp. DTA98]|uniref:protein-L-isoaspartate(D-aspartate) O-methyltransferase n=1 Tax=Halorubrum sp. DTA98 TaxID=3402163 RepID=UPI003AAA9BC7
MDDTEQAVARRRLIERLRRRTDVSDRTLAALESVPRHEFVPDRLRSAAYADRPLPIGHDQTISAPHMVAIMTDLLDVDEGDRVLEIGTGCGYHAAVVSEVVGPETVYSVEYVPELAADARRRFDRLGYDVSVHVGDGREGLPSEAPFDATYLTCAAADGVPDPLLADTCVGGRIVAPIGGGRSQRLVRLTVREGGDVDREDHGGVRFVPLQ